MRVKAVRSSLGSRSSSSTVSSVVNSRFFHSTFASPICSTCSHDLPCDYACAALVLRGQLRANAPPHPAAVKGTDYAQVYKGRQNMLFCCAGLYYARNLQHAYILMFAESLTSTILRPAGSSSSTFLFPRFLMSRKMPVLSADTGSPCLRRPILTPHFSSSRKFHAAVEVPIHTTARLVSQLKVTSLPGLVKMRKSVCGGQSYVDCKTSKEDLIALFDTLLRSYT